MVEYSVKYSHNYTHYSNEWKDCLRFVIVCKRTPIRITSNHDFNVKSHY